MSFSAQLKETIREFHLLSHPFYQAWTAGKLTQEQLQEYAVQYKPFVEAFPRFVSALHSNCEDAAAREEILENLMDEEGKTGRSALRIRSYGRISWTASARKTMRNTAMLRCTPRKRSSNSANLPMKKAFAPFILTNTRRLRFQRPRSEGLKKFYGITDRAQP